MNPTQIAEVRELVDLLPGGETGVADFCAKSSGLTSCYKLPGDASTRQYFRIFFKDGSTAILMKMESFATEGNGLSFIAIQTHLSQAGVDVPRILDVDPTRAMILLEDLTDVTLLRRLQDVSGAETERHLYQKVIDQLVSMHANASPEKSGTELPAFKLSFDHEKLMWEVNFTFEHFYDGYLKRKIRSEDRALMLGAFSEICTLLASEPKVFTHRDFHSRNVMVTPHGDQERLVMIDFQDARMGPAQYDLASLLKDSYYQLEEAQIERLLDYYVVAWEAKTGAHTDRQRFRMVFDLMSVQRNFKAIGSFASFENRRGNPAYLKYIGNTFENIRRTLLKYPQYARLRELLFHYYYF